MTYSLDLLFREPSKGNFPEPSIAQIYVKTHTSDKEGHIFITSDCVSLTEIEAQIERLNRELETIRKQANQKFRKGR